MFFAKILMYGVISVAMAMFGTSIIGNTIACISIFGCVIAIDVLSMMHMRNSVTKLMRKNME